MKKQVPVIEVQKFQKGDLVQITKDLGPSMCHFPNDALAIVLYSSRKGSVAPEGGNIYALFVEDHGYSAWYEEDQLTLVQSGRDDLLDLWEQEKNSLASYHIALVLAKADAKHVKSDKSLIPGRIHKEIQQLRDHHAKVTWYTNCANAVGSNNLVMNLNKLEIGLKQSIDNLQGILNDLVKKE